MRTRLVLGIILLVAASVFSSARLGSPREMWLRMIGFEGTGRQETIKYFDRVRELKGALPGKGYVGFATDHTDYLVYLLAENALVPLILDDKTPRKYIVGIFKDPRNREAFIEKGVDVFRETGDDIVLVKTRSSQ